MTGQTSSSEFGVHAGMIVAPAAFSAPRRAHPRKPARASARAALSRARCRADLPAAETTTASFLGAQPDQSLALRGAARQQRRAVGVVGQASACRSSRPHAQHLEKEPLRLRDAGQRRQAAGCCASFGSAAAGGRRRDRVAGQFASPCEWHCPAWRAAAARARRPAARCNSSSSPSPPGPRWPGLAQQAGGQQPAVATAALVENHHRQVLRASAQCCMPSSQTTMSTSGWRASEQPAGLGAAAPD